MMAELGGTRSMRGYYEGRYRDKHSLEATVELRQHVWKRNGIVSVGWSWNHLPEIFGIAL